jgi:hypothetical protein
MIRTRIRIGIGTTVTKTNRSPSAKTETAQCPEAPPVPRLLFFEHGAPAANIEVKTFGDEQNPADDEVKEAVQQNPELSADESTARPYCGESPHKPTRHVPWPGLERAALATISLASLSDWVCSQSSAPRPFFCHGSGVAFQRPLPPYVCALERPIVRNASQRARAIGNSAGL